ncbi:hypothetical protein [Streptomyces sp. NPDC001851]|uniref:hypothetical protein n=1 Tax=Streptomyces sp. NPDC001851 TaxID=3154529 RepID=UPI003319E1D9
MAAESANDTDGTGATAEGSDAPSGGFIRKIWDSRPKLLLISLALLVAAAPLAVPMALAYRNRESPLLSASTVVGGPSLSNGRTVQVSFKIPKGYSQLVLRFGLRNQRPAECLGAGTVDLRAVSGTADPQWHLKTGASDVVTQIVKIKEPSDLVVLSVGLTTLGDCRTDLQVLPYRVMDRSGGPVSVEAIVLASVSALLTVPAAVFLLRYLWFDWRSVWLGLSRSRRERSYDWEPRVRLRVAEDRLAEALRQPAPPPRPAQRTGPDDEHPPDQGRQDHASSRSTSDRLGLSNLWDVTHARLDLYHRIATGQASKSFRNAQIAMGSGFVLLIGFTVLAIVARSPTASVVAGALGVTSAGLAGYVSRTFVRSQENAASHLRAYFDQPLEFSRFLAAERLIADAGLSAEQRAEILAGLVRAMVASGLPPGATTDATTSGEPGRNGAADQAPAE